MAIEISVYTDYAEEARVRGILVTALGVLVLSSDAVLVRLIAGDAFTVAFWRGALMALGFWSLYALQTRSPALQDIVRPSAATLLAAMLFAVSSTSFVGAVKHTAVANVLLIMATIPLSGALFSWLAYREPVGRSTWLAIGGALTGLLVILAEDLESGDALGNGLAVLVSLSTGAYFTVLRSRRVSSALPALTLAGLFSALASALLASGLEVQQEDIPYVLLLGLLVIPVSFSLISLGPRSLPAAEVGLLMLLETVFGAAWAWGVLDEVPTQMAMIGGGVILLSVIAKNLVDRRSIQS